MLKIIPCLEKSGNLEKIRKAKNFTSHDEKKVSDVAKCWWVIESPFSWVPFLLTFYVPNLGSRTQNMTSLAF